MIGKARASAASNPFSKARGAVAPPPVEAPPKALEPSVAQLSDADAEARLKATLAAKSKDDMSDYVFATPGLDPRMAGRVSSWIQEIEEKDRYTEGHARQVAELSVAIAQEAGLTGKDTDVVRLAALLHDVGKRACPPQILQKRDEDLTDPELIVMMKHPLDGAELLESFPDLKHLADIVRSHHEEFDGNGYPQGLKGDEIPVAARIIAVANSYHSLTSKMVYGEGLPAEKAQAQLVKGAGKQWDPNFVQALVQAIINKKVPAAF
jgi:putative nucleotidyltransferase with HDIG domain